MTTEQSDHASNAKEDCNDRFEDGHQPSPLAHGLTLLCLYVVMYLAVAALLHNVAPFATALWTVEASFADAARVLSGDPSEAPADFGSRSRATRKTPSMDTNCD